MCIQIFLAHASEDKASVLELYDRLKQKGYQPWLDKKSLIAGQNWREEIPKAVRSSQIFVACFSQRSVNKQGYIQRELRMALNEYAEKPPGEIYLIPLKLEDCEIPDLRLDQLGVSLRDLHWLDYWETDGFESLVRAIEFQIGRLEPSESAASMSSASNLSTDHQLSLSLPESTRRTQAMEAISPASSVPVRGGQRLALFQKLAGLLSSQFEQVLFCLNLPAGNVPSAEVGRRDRIEALLDWADSSIGCGFDQVEAIYLQVVNPQ